MKKFVADVLRQVSNLAVALDVEDERHRRLHIKTMDTKQVVALGEGFRAVKLRTVTCLHLISLRA